MFERAMMSKPSPTAKQADKTNRRIMRRFQWQYIYTVLDGAIRVDLHEQWAILRTLVKWLLLGGAVGILSGTASAIFLETLRWATETRIQYPTLLYLLPIIGLVVGWVYYTYAGAAARGNNLVIEEVNVNREPIPLRMAPLVLIGTILTHLFGGSAGREGTAIQMGSSLADWLQRQFGLSQQDRRLMLMAGISGGFGSVFGTPIAGFVFGLEVQSIGRIRYEGVLPCFVAAAVGDWTTRAYGVGHSHYPVMATMELAPMLMTKVMIAGLAFGLTSLLFIELTDAIRHIGKHFIPYSPYRLVVGGLAIIALTGLVGTRDYLGLSLPLIHASVSGEGVIAFAFLLKLIFTAITLGTGYLGGEVTPLFVMGSTLGYSLGRLLGIDPAFAASIGFVAVFAGATNTPLACTMMGIELFGGGSVLYLAIGCFSAYLVSGQRSIYITQRIGVMKSIQGELPIEQTVEDAAHKRPGWLPQIPMFNTNIWERPVRAIMALNPIIINEDTPLNQLIPLMLKEGIRTVPVVDSARKLCGIITDYDLLQRGKVGIRLGLLENLPSAAQEPLLNGNGLRLARDVMNTNVISITPEQPLAAAAQLMQQHRIKRLPVVNRNNRVVGIITRSDILRVISFVQVAPALATEEIQPLGGIDRPVSNLIYDKVVTVEQDVTLDKLVQAMLQTAQQRLLVVHQQRLVGIITDGDLLTRIAPEYHPAIIEALTTRSEFLAKHTSSHLPKAVDIMTTPVVTITRNTSIEEALKLMLTQRIKRIPIVDEQNRPIGIIGRAGLLQALIAPSNDNNPHLDT